MPPLRLKQLQFETDTMKRLIAFLKDENVYLKNRISEILENDFDHSMLDTVDDFQTRSIQEDDLIEQLRKSTVELDRLLLREDGDEEKLLKQIDLKLKRLNSDLQAAQKLFVKLKTGLNSFIKENV